MKQVGDTSQVPSKIQALYQITNELEAMFPGSKFTPDGHMIGSIGEVLVASKYHLELLDNSVKTHDAVTKDGKMVQIKATQTNRISISSEPDYLIVIQIDTAGSWMEIYNGPGKEPWEYAGKMQKNGQRAISLSKLKRLMVHVSPSDQISEGPADRLKEL